MSSTKIQWRVQVRKSRAHKWVNKGLFETRRMARFAAYAERVGGDCIETSGTSRRFYSGPIEGYGFGNTRVVRYEKGAPK